MIDVIIPSYNCTSTIEKTLSSLVAQSDRNFKTIVVDDCSTDNLYDVIIKYKDKLDIKYIKNKNNIGCGMSRQVGIDNSSSSYFCFLDSDDMFMPYTVEFFNSVILDDSEVEILHSYFYEQNDIDNHKAIILRKDGYTFCHGKLYKRSAINKYNIKNSEQVKYADDSYFNSMCFELLKTRTLELPLYYYTNNPNSVIRKKNNERDLIVKKDFINAMVLSCKHVLRFKKNVNHIPYTLKVIENNGILTIEEKKLYDELKNLTIERSVD